MAIEASSELSEEPRAGAFDPHAFAAGLVAIIEERYSSPNPVDPVSRARQEVPGFDIVMSAVETALTPIRQTTPGTVRDVLAGVAASTLLFAGKKPTETELIAQSPDEPADHRHQS